MNHPVPVLGCPRKHRIWYLSTILKRFSRESFRQFDFTKGNKFAVKHCNLSYIFDSIEKRGFNPHLPSNKKFQLFWLGCKRNISVFSTTLTLHKRSFWNPHTKTKENHHNENTAICHSHWPLPLADHKSWLLSFANIDGQCWIAMSMANVNAQHKQPKMMANFKLDVG